MDVKLPDGTVIKDVPDGISKIDLIAKLKANGYDTSGLSQGMTGVNAIPTGGEQTIPQQIEEPSFLSKAGSFVGDIGRQVGLTARHGLEAVGSVPQIVGQAMEGMGVKGAGGNLGEMASNYVGLPTPQTTEEKIVGGATKAMVSGMPLIKAGQVLQSAQSASPMARTVGGVMASQPTAQTGLAGVSGASSEYAKEQGAGPIGQIAAGVIAPMIAAPTAGLVYGTGKLAKNIVAPMVSDKAAEIGAARLVNKATGSRSEEVAQALASGDKNFTAGQIAASIDNTDLAALQKIANKRDATLARTVKEGVDFKINQAWDTLEKDLAPKRNEALEIASSATKTDPFQLVDYKGVDTNPILNRVTSYQNTSGNKIDTVLQGVTNDIKDKVRIITENGVADPNELYTIRKQIGSIIQNHSKESANWDKKKSAYIERSMQLAIDDAIEKAISKANPEKAGLWNQYMTEYAGRAKSISTIQENLGKELKLANQGMPKVSAVVGGAENNIPHVNWLSRIAAIANASIRVAEGSSGSRVEQSMTRMMAPEAFGGDKAKLAKLMMEQKNKPPGFFKSMFYQNQPTRAELGYGKEGMLSGEQP